jgi:large subunit ribosomal protein L15
MDLSKIKVRIKNRKIRRVGRGTGSGRGKTSGRGNKGTGQRGGKKLPYIGFNGGNIPYARKIPKRGFNSPYENNIQIVNLESIQQKLKDNTEITPEVLRGANLVKDVNKPIKILADLKGEFILKATFKADSFSNKAKQMIEKVGGKVEYLKR